MELLLKRRPFWVDLILMIAGTGLMAVAIQCIFDPIGLVTGGFTGIAIIAKSLTHGKIPLWLANLILNIPLFLVAIYINHRIQLNREERLKTPLGEFVEVNGHKMSVYVEGDGGGGVVKEQLIQQ